MNKTTTVSLDTLAGLYRAAYLIEDGAENAMARVVEAIARSAYSEAQVAESAGFPLAAIPVPGTAEYDEETELMQEAADAMRNLPMVSVHTHSHVK